MSPPRRPTRFVRCLCTTIAAVATILAAATCLSATTSDSRQLILSEDLRPYGSVGYERALFLTDNLLLVVANQEEHLAPIHPLLRDEPPSKFLLFDLDQKKLVKTAEYPVEKIAFPVYATKNGHFVVLNLKGLHVCSSDLTCGPAFATEGPVRVLPGGTKLLVGGNGQTEVDVLDASTLQVLSRPAPANLKADIFRDGILLNGHKLINDNTVADSREPEMRVQRVDGTELYRVPVTTQYLILIPNRSGSRFFLLEEGYTKWNSIINFLDIDQGRPFNFVRVRVFDTASGKQLFELHWDPRPQSIPTPGLSPDGKRITLIRHAKLEVYALP
jgi:hypothetical protein